MNDFPIDDMDDIRSELSGGGLHLENIEQPCDRSIFVEQAEEAEILAAVLPASVPQKTVEPKKFSFDMKAIVPST